MGGPGQSGGLPTSASTVELTGEYSLGLNSTRTLRLDDTVRLTVGEGFYRYNIRGLDHNVTYRSP